MLVCERAFVSCVDAYVLGLPLSSCVVSQSLQDTLQHAGLISCRGSLGESWREQALYSLSPEKHAQDLGCHTPSCLAPHLSILLF